MLNVQQEISNYINRQPRPKQDDMLALHSLALKILPGGKLWFDEGKDETNKTVTNPTVGYGSYTIKYADGKTREFFQIGFSGNTSGISVYIMGIKDRTYLPKHYTYTIGKASVTGYCIKFKKLSDVDISMLEQAMRYGIAASS